MKIDVKVPTIGESISEVTIGQWLIENGESVEVDEPICEIESEKATVEVVAEYAGTLNILVDEGETAEIGRVIAEIDSDGKLEKKLAKTENKQQEKVKEVQKDKFSDQKSRVSPVASNILKSAGIDSAKISGTGEGGRVTKSDALKAVESKSKIPEKNESPKTEKPKTDAKVVPGAREMRVEKMSTIRKTIARRMLEAKQGTAMLTTINEIDLSEVVKIRKQYKDIFKEKHEVGLGFMSFFTKAVTLALSEFPVVNAQLDGDNIIYQDFCDISIAVSTEKGLVVPVIRNAESMTLAQIETTILELAARARENKLSIDEMSGGTFSITNGGVFGSLISTPLINSPQSAILGMHSIQDRPVARNGEVVIRPMMYVSLSYDHRIIDGKESVSFLVRVKEILEDPIRMLLGV
jgi:2-oxoglutarate dehydrogenase E2 component (dihydrolipoamide succinyltransferase)